MQRAKRNSLQDQKIERAGKDLSQRFHMFT
jgi:hypothetical protein